MTRLGLGFATRERCVWAAAHDKRGVSVSRQRAEVEAELDPHATGRELSHMFDKLSILRESALWTLHLRCARARWLLAGAYEHIHI